jgi:small subunit ribosomal protein S18
MSNSQRNPEAELDDEDVLVDDEVFEEDIPAADDDDYDGDDSYDEDEDGDVAYVDGPAIFARTREGAGGGGGGGRRRNVRSMAREVKMEDINYKRVQVLSRFVDRQGRILSRRKTRVSAKMQRKVATEIKRARHLALMPYTREHVRITRKGS